MKYFWNTIFFFFSMEANKSVGTIGGTLLDFKINSVHILRLLVKMKRFVKYFTKHFKKLIFFENLKP